MKGTKRFCTFLEDTSVMKFGFYIFTKKSTPPKEKFNIYANIRVTHILYTRTTPEAYLEPNSTSTTELFLQKEAVSIFFKNALSQMLDCVLNTPVETLKGMASTKRKSFD